jgi:hypothetical protein
MVVPGGDPILLTQRISGKFFTRLTQKGPPAQFFHHGLEKHDMRMKRGNMSVSSDVTFASACSYTSVSIFPGIYYLRTIYFSSVQVIVLFDREKRAMLT